MRPFLFIAAPFTLLGSIVCLLTIIALTISGGCSSSKTDGSAAPNGPVAGDLFDLYEKSAAAEKADNGKDLHAGRRIINASEGKRFTGSGTVFDSGQTTLGTATPQYIYVKNDAGAMAFLIHFRPANYKSRLTVKGDKIKFLVEMKGETGPRPHVVDYEIINP